MSHSLNPNHLPTYPAFFRAKEKHYFHLVINSQLPVITATAALLLVLNVVFYLHLADIVSFKIFDNLNFQIAWFIFSTILFAWFLTVIAEAGQGYHTLAVRQGLRFGMILFIISEIMFFFAFFWAFFHVSLSPSIAIGGIWPPKSIQALDVWGLPLVNTILLLSSGVTITLAHHAMMQTANDHAVHHFNTYLLATIILGVTFLYCQGIEYKYGITFRWKENIYGSTFFVTTGFHGLHVTIGTIFLLFCLLRNLMTSSRGWWNDAQVWEDFRVYLANKAPFLGWSAKKLPFGNLSLGHSLNLVAKISAPYKMTKEQHLGFEAAAWYWHFVDVVWIFLFITIYWWGC